MPLIFSAIRRGSEDTCTIVVWCKNLDLLVDEVKPEPAQHAERTLLKTLLQFCMLFMTIAFLWQNIGVRYT